MGEGNNRRRLSHTGSDRILLQIGDCYIVQRNERDFIVASHRQRYVVLSRKRMEEEIINLVERVIAQ